MHHFGFLTSKCNLPEAASPELAARGLEGWLDAAGEADGGKKSTGTLRRFAESAERPG